MAFQIVYHAECLKRDFLPLDPSIRRRIRQTIEARLTTAPAEYGKPLRHTVEGLWSLRMGDWRVIYKIVGNEVVVLRIGHRREVYRFLG